MPRRALLVYNPAAGRRGRQLEQVRAALERGGWEIEAASTEAPGHATELAGQGAAAGAEAIFALGGDGTLREAAAGLLDGGVPLGLLAGGTANVLARALGLPPSAVRAAELLDAVGSRRVEMDVGSCGGKPFLMMASSGLDARALLALDPAAKQRWGRAAVLVAGLRAWRAPQAPIAIRFAGREIAAGFAAVCNISLYGGPFRLAPAARWDDGRLDVVVHRSCGRLAQLGFAIGVLTGRHQRRHDVLCATATEVTIEDRGGQQLVLQIDGDPWVTTSPVTVRLDARRLALLLPARPP